MSQSLSTPKPISAVKQPRSTVSSELEVGSKSSQSPPQPLASGPSPSMSMSVGGNVHPTPAWQTSSVHASPSVQPSTSTQRFLLSSQNAVDEHSGVVTPQSRSIRQIPPGGHGSQTVPPQSMSVS